METKFISNQNMTGNIEKSNENSFLKKVKEHKKEIAIGTAIFFSVMGMVLVVKNKEALKSVIKSSFVEEVLTKKIEYLSDASPLISESIEKNITSKLPVRNTFNVREHIRNLPEGWNPSNSKVKLAEKYGYLLEEHQTWVIAYTKASA